MKCDVRMPTADPQVRAHTVEIGGEEEPKSARCHVSTPPADTQVRAHGEEEPEPTKYYERVPPQSRAWAEVTLGRTGRTGRSQLCTTWAQSPCERAEGEKEESEGRARCEGPRR